MTFLGLHLVILDFYLSAWCCGAPLSQYWFYSKKLFGTGVSTTIHPYYTDIEASLDFLRSSHRFTTYMTPSIIGAATNTEREALSRISGGD